MSCHNRTRLQTLLWEMFCRAKYIVFSFLISVVICYQNSISLLYLFVYSYHHKNIENKLFLDLALINFNQLNCDNAIKVQKSYDQLTASMQSMISWDNLNLLYNDNFFCCLSKENLTRFCSVLNDIQLSSVKFIFTDVEEAFSSSVFICFIFSFIAIFPYAIYNLFSFLAPSFYKYESKQFTVTAISLILFWFFFIINLQNNIIPKLSFFLLNFQIENSAFNVEAETKIYSYLIWVNNIFIIANLLFFLFFLIILLVIKNKVNLNYLILYRKWFQIILLLITAFIAPPDLLTQSFLAFTSIFCFEILIYFFILYKNCFASKTKFCLANHLR